MRISDWSSVVCSSDLRAFGNVDVCELLVQLRLLKRVGLFGRQTLRINYVILDVLPALNLHGVLPQVVGLLIAVPADLLLTKDLVGHKHVFDDLIPLAVRSEEHTSELQSLMRISYAVFCLKKKKQIHNQKH